MAATNLEALKLRGVSVRVGGVAVTLRPGSYAADNQAPMVPLSMRHPSPGCRRKQTEPPQRPCDRTSDAGVARAGRPGGSVGVVARRSPARSAGRAVPFRQPTVVGASQPHRAAYEGRLLPSIVVGGEALLPGHLLTGPAELRRGVSTAWRKPAGRTPAVSTEGTGG